MRYFIIVTYGRSGSTALQAAANALPGVLIRGENYSALRGLRGYLQSVAATAHRHHAGRPDHPWFGSARLDPGAIRAMVHTHVIDDLLRPRGRTSVLGFKEIRYTTAHWPNYDELLEYLLFMNTLLPGLRYLINTRSDADGSAWWRDEPDAQHIVQESARWLTDAASDLGAIVGTDRVRLLRYDEWRENPGLVVDAFAALGLPVDEAIVRQTLAQHLRHGQR
jgi:hypothetical protein